MSDAPLVSVIVPTLNNWSMTRECLSSLHQHSRGADCEVLLVDNCSTDATASEAGPLGRALFGSRFRLLRQEANLGFARAINLGARGATGRYLYLLNNDTVIGSDPFSAPIGLLQADPSLGAAGPLLLYPGGSRVQHLGISVAHGIKCVHLYHLFPSAHPVAARTRRLQALTMAAFCVERDLFLRLDGLFEGFVNGMEDVDFCARMGSLGLACAVAPASVVCHIAGQSVGRYARDAENSRLLSARCAKLLSPDMDALALADGYLLRLTPWLDPYLVPVAEREEELDAMWEARPEPEALPELLESEPCWRRGWNMLAAHFRAVGDAAGEAGALTRQSAFLPSAENLAAIRAAATKAGDAARLALLNDQEARLHAVLSRPLALRAQARAALGRAEAAGNAALAGLLNSWLAEHFPGGDGA